MRQLATAWDGTGYEVSGDAGSAELYEDGVMVVSVATFREAREEAQRRVAQGLVALEWRTEHD